MNIDRPFYGWRVVGAAFAVMFFAYGLQFSYGVFAASMASDLGWGRADTALPYSLYVFCYSALSAMTGRATDRQGPRRVISFGAVLIGTGWGLSAVVREPWQLTVTLGLVAAVGMSVTWVPCNATVARWFTRRRGTAVAIASTGASLGNFAGPWLTALLIERWGWRTTLACLSLFTAATVMVAARFMVRDPEALGQWPDGDTEPPPAHVLVGGLRVSELWRLPSFHLIVAIYFLTWLVIFMPFVHGPAHAADLGLDALAGASLLSAIGLGGVAGRLGAGAVSDRIGRCPALFAVCALQGLSFVLFALARDLTGLWMAALIFGVSYGGGVALLPPLCGDLFGRAHVASVVGVIFAVAGAPAAFGPWFAGWLYDSNGSYSGAFFTAAGLNALACLLIGVLAIQLRRAPPSYTVAEQDPSPPRA